jgi:lysylphosphatidylglycerol synthetase-like protein (DUF2156 family)
MTSLALAPLDPRARAFSIVRHHGHDTVSFQTLESGYNYWFDGEDAYVAYLDTGGAWVAAGGPVAPRERVADVAHAFCAAARAADRRACFFAAEAELVAAGYPAIAIGEQPVWNTGEWSDVVRATSSLRYQLRRAWRKGVSVRQLDATDVDRDTTSRIAELSRSWQAAQRMAPMRFLVQLEPLGFAAERVLIVAEREGEIVGLASAVPVYARDRLFVEDLVRAPHAPNGTAELLVDAVMRAAPVPQLTLGLAPLAGDISPWLRVARWLGKPFYDFAGLRAFKAKLRPHAWEPIYLCVEPGGSKLIAMRDSLRAFAGGSLFAFAARTLFRRDE